MKQHYTSPITGEIFSIGMNKLELIKRIKVKIMERVTIEELQEVEEDNSIEYDPECQDIVNSFRYY